jgi:hypothetical protein
VDSEKLFVVKRITTYKNRNKGKGNSKTAIFTHRAAVFRNADSLPLSGR